MDRRAGGWTHGHVLPKILRRIGNQIFLTMGLRSRACGAGVMVQALTFSVNVTLKSLDWWITNVESFLVKC